MVPGAIPLLGRQPSFLKEIRMTVITKEQLRTDLVRIIGVLTNLKPADVKDGQRLREDLGLDSLQSMEMLFRIIDKFMLDVKMEDVMDLQTVGQVVDRLFLFIQDGGKKLA
jgi:acyl carrier protein